MIRNDFDTIKVLIVDDLDDNRTLLRLDLEDDLPGVHIDEAENGAEALKLLNEKEFTLVLCDLMMPDINGFEVFERSKKIEKAQNIPFIFISANQDRSVFEKGLELGAIDFLTKPYDVFELSNKVRNLSRLKYYMDQQAELVHKVERSNAELEASNNQKDEVLRIVSHDMRNPLGNIIGLASILKEEPDQTREDIQRIGEVLVRSGENLLEIVTSLLDAARIEAGKVTMEVSKFDVVQFLKDELTQFENAAKKKEIFLELESFCSSFVIEADQGKLKQIISNIVSNALKFTVGGGKVTVGITCPEGKEVQLFVSDTGVGISKEHLPIVFEKFSGAHRRGTSNESGTGLGLSIVKSLVEMHKGKINIASEVGKGTKITITLPVHFQVE